MELSQEQINSILEDAKPSIVEGLKKQVSTACVYNLKQLVSDEVTKEVKAYISAEIIPEIRRQLIESKEGLISSAVKMGPIVVEELTKTLANNVKKNLESSWNRKSILEGLFKD